MSALDQTSTSVGFSVTPSSGVTAAITQTDELAIGAVGVVSSDNSITFAPGGGYTALGHVEDNGEGVQSLTHLYIDPEAQVVGTSQGYAADGTLIQPGVLEVDWAAAVAIYKAEPLVTHFSVIPSATTVTTNTPVSITVAALDAFNDVVPGYQGTIHFGIQGASSTLPADYTFLASDNGTHTFSNAISFSTPVNGAIVSATDTLDATVAGAANITATPPVTITHFSISAPASASLAAPISFIVTALDKNNTVVTNYLGAVHFTSSDPLAVLPFDYTFTLGQGGDNGVHLFTGVLLRTPGVPTLTATDVFTATLTGATSVQILNVAPTITGLSPTSFVEGSQASTLTVTGTGFNGSSAITINGVDRTTILDNGSQVSTTLTPADVAKVGTLTVAVVNAGQGGGVSGSETLVITPAPLTAASPITIKTTEGGIFTGVLAFFTDGAGSPPANDFTALVDWGDGNSTFATVVAFGSGFNVFGSHSYAQVGAFTLGMTVFDAGGSTVAIGGTASVADAPLTAFNKTFAAVEGVFNGAVASFADADSNGFAGENAATIDWGDNSTSLGTVAANGTGFDVIGNHTYKVGAYTLTITIADAGGSIAIAHSTANVSDAPLSAVAHNFSVTGNKKFSGLVATFTDPDPAGVASQYTASITWDDGSTTAGVVSGVGSSFSVAGTHTFTAFSGSHTISVKITDQASPVTVTDTILDPPATGGDSSTPGSVNQFFVSQLYQDLLQRPADAVGLASWTNALDQAAMTRIQVVQAIEGSSEYRTVEVQALFGQLLHRQADAGGLAGLTSFLAGGGTLEQAQAILAGSDEYFQVRGGSNTDGFVQALYHDGLGRNADAAGLATFEQFLAGGMSRRQAAEAIFSSDEYRQDLVQGYYQQFLLRGADSLGLAAFTDALKLGMKDQDVIAVFVASDEYLNRLGSPATP